MRRNVEVGGLDEALEAVHVRARAAGSRFDPELSVRALGVLAAWSRVGQRVSPPPAMRAILEAERFLTTHHAEPVNIAELARRLGIAYSHFRRQFRAYTGYAPWQYVLRLRLVRARRRLASNDATLDQIATELGFNSAFHFSAAFKQAFGQAPDYWRRRRPTGPVK